METIQVQVSTDLARRLRPHVHELPQILEWGLRQVEQKEAVPPARRAAEVQREEVLAALRSTGLVVELDPAIAARYQVLAAQPLRTPVQVEGQPLSELIIRERGPEWTNEP
jgi:hypothetical protein